ncbi:hypothetical protein HQ576_09270, partial [bacterium]|nr:hypothetical protein [bacterium]
MTSEPTGRNRQPFWVVLPWILLGVVAVLWGVRAGGPSVSAKKPPPQKADGVPSTPPAAPAAPALPSASTPDTAAPEPPAYMPSAGVEAAEGASDLANGMAPRMGDALGGTAAGTPAGTPDYGTSTTPDYGTDSNTDYGTKPGTGTTAADVYAPDAGTTTDDGGDASAEDYGTGTPDTTIARVP